MQNEINSFLSNFEKTNISILASSISEYYFPNTLIKPYLIAEKKGITYSFGKYEDAFDGLIEYSCNSFHIYINLDRVGVHDSKRSRFTFGHELGHYFLDSHRNTLTSGESLSHCSFTGFVNQNKAERQADYFAACLLMPENGFQRTCFKKKFSFDLIKELSTKYGTSISSTAIRFADIGNHPIMVVYSKNNRIIWYSCSGDFPYKQLKYGKLKVPEDSVAGEYFELSRAPKNTQIVFASDWFYYVKKYDVNRKFYEHCLFSGEHVLSIIWED